MRHAPGWARLAAMKLAIPKAKSGVSDHLSVAPLATLACVGGRYDRWFR
jgi:hypothetical protein